MTSWFKSRSRRLLPFSLVVLQTLAAAPEVLAQNDDEEDGGQCAIKFVCGRADAPPLRAVPGEYATAINIFNGDDETVEYTKRLAFTTPCVPEQDPEIEGPTTEPIEGDVRSLGAFDVDCREVFIEFEGIDCADYVEGFLVLESEDLDDLTITAVYTAAPAPNGTEVPGAVSIDVERVKCGADDDDNDKKDKKDDD